ncbi:MAG: hypothetical protein KDC67_06060 [Ignavibacteriae bacterium]|nr:hypothetical protein [Ignavibacteriota bacterium]
MIFLTQHKEDWQQDTPRIWAVSWEWAEIVAEIQDKNIKVIGKLIKEEKL